MRKFCLLISVLLLICTLLTGVAYASSPIPTVTTKTPSNDVYYDTVAPTLAYKTEDYTVIVDKVEDEYHILTYTDTLISDLTVGSSPIDTACVYGDYAILCTNDGTLLVYDLIGKIQHSVTGLPSDVYSISLTGSKLYAQTSNIKVYDLLELENGIVTELVTYDSGELFKLGFGIYAVDNTVYYTKQSANISTIYSYDCQENASTQICEVAHLSDFVVDGGKVYALTSSSNKLYYYDIQSKIDGEIELKHTTPCHISVYSGELAVTHSILRTIDLYDIATDTPKYKTSLCSDSDLLGRFDTPMDVYAYEDSYAVADFGNDRVQVFRKSGDVSYINVTAPKSVALGDVTVVSSNSTIYVYGNKLNTYTSANDITFNGITDLTIDANGTIYAIDTQNDRVIYKAKDDSEFKTFINTAPKSIAVAPHGSVVYCAYSGVIHAYDSSARIIFSAFGIPTFDKASVAVDATGTTFILDDTTLYTYKRTLTGFTLLSTDTINLPQGGVREITVSSTGEVLLVDGVRHQVFEIKNTKALSYTPTESNDSVYEKTTINEAVQLVYVGSDTFIYDDVDNYETTRVVKADTTLVLLSNVPVGDFYYVYYDGPSYIPVSKVTKVTVDTNEYDALALHSNTPLYKYPILDDNFKLLTVGKEATFKVITNVADFSWNGAYWNQIVYNGEVYYITRNNVGLAPTDRVVDYGWAKLHSSVMGQKIKVYSLSDDKSGVIGEYADGTEVKLLTEIDGASTFTRIQIGDDIGYVKTNELTTGGMTTAQIVILVLILLGGTASVTILVISRKMHKRR